MELANLSYVGLVVGQLLAQELDVTASVIGSVMFISGYTGAILLMKGKYV